MKTVDIPKTLPAPAHIVHFGAGTCNELDYYLQSGAKQITLVEACPDICISLRQKVGSHKQVQLIQAAVAVASNDASLFVYNLSAANSLREATELYDIFPGLKLKTKIPLTTTSPCELLQPLELDSQHTHWLILDTPGEELPILEAMHGSEQLDSFSLLKMYCGTGKFYKDSVDASTLLQRLRGWGYEVISQDKQSDPDRPCWTLCRNVLYPELVDAKKKLSELQRELDKVNKTIAEEGELLQKIEKANQDLSASRQEASENAKLLKLKENDFKDLQQRYKHAINTQEQQHQLLIQIGERLQLASKYFHDDIEGVLAKDIKERTAQHLKLSEGKITPKNKSPDKAKRKS
tara:strand:- start:1082 stop:2128 length:1047 start_codon:yes stop_codon:yes gene_type:complete